MNHFLAQDMNSHLGVVALFLSVICSSLGCSAGRHLHDEVLGSHTVEFSVSSPPEIVKAAISEIFLERNYRVVRKSDRIIVTETPTAERYYSIFVTGWPGPEGWAIGSHSMVRVLCLGPVSPSPLFGLENQLTYPVPLHIRSDLQKIPEKIKTIEKVRGESAEDRQ